MSSLWTSKPGEGQLHEEIREAALRKIGSTWFHDSMYMFVFPLIGLASLISNLVSFHIFSGPYFSRRPLYTYFRANCLNSSLIGLVLMSNFLWYARRYLDFSNSELATFFRCYVSFPIMFCAYFFGCCIDIVLSFERISDLSGFRFSKCRPTRVCWLLLVFSFVVNLPSFILFEPIKRPLYVDQHSNSTVYFFHYGETPFALSRAGIIFKSVFYMIRDFFTLILLVILNISSLILFRRNYYIKTRMKEASLVVINLSQLVNETNALTAEKSCDIMTGDCNSHSKGSGLERCKAKRTRLYLNMIQANKMLTKMVIVICTLSTLEHLFILLTIVYVTCYLKPYLVYIFFITNVVVLLKHSINFFIFFNYNNYFHTRFLNMFRRKSQ